MYAIQPLMAILLRCTYGAKVWKSEMAVEYFQDVATSLTVTKARYLVTDATLDHRNLARRHVHYTQLRGQLQSACTHLSTI